MFLQFSPVHREVKPKKEQKIVEDEISVLSLAPFSANPKICFENVPLGKTATQKLLIKNPTNRAIQLQVFDNFPEEINVELNWNQQVIDENNEAILAISWTPSCDGSWRHTLHLEDGCRLKRDIPIAFKSLPKKSVKEKRKQLPSYNTKKKKRSPVSSKLLPKKKSPKIVITTENKENFDFNNIDDKRSTYCIKSTNFVPSPSPKDPNFSDSLEMLSPDISPAFDREKKLSCLQLSAFNFSPIVSTPQQDSLTFFNNSSRENLQNLSSETYVKGNLSAETYVKGNLSSETYVKDSPNRQISPQICKKSDSFALRLDSLTGFKAKNVIEANLWSENVQNASTKKKSLLTIREESFSSDYLAPVSLKRKSDTTFNITPNKKPYLDSISRGGITDWSLHGTLPFKFKKKQSSSVTINTNTVYVQNAFLLTVDPFLTFSIYCNQEWVEEQEECFKKWLNALLTPPSEMDCSKDPVIDVAKLWKLCKKIEVPTAPSLELVSNRVHISSRLNSLRKAATNLFQSHEMSSVLSNIVGAIEKNKLCIRQDRDIHLDLSLQSEIMSIILSYNTLWLRIGLETVYNQVIPLNSNSDVLGLSKFIYERFFKDPFLLRKHKSVHSPKYSVEIKKFIMKKFLTLVYFLDQAKVKKLIQHDPCLFSKNAEIKESREALLKFARDTLLTVGDITKYLKHFGYYVVHKQTYINEFDYAVKCLGVDLRDGVRLTKVMEIILMRKDLSCGLRVPAISLLQKIHNVKIVFDALAEAGYTIQSEIAPKDIVNGHKEKTLSFLWQIIYKFQAPLMVKHAGIIQTWWRSRRIVQKREVLREQRARKHSAAVKIQKWYRRIVLAGQIEEFAAFGRKYAENLRRNRAAVKIQTAIRTWLARKKYVKIRSTVIGVQFYCRKVLQEICYHKRICAAIHIQSVWRMFLARKAFLEKKYAVLVIQHRFRAQKLMKYEKTYFEALKYSVILVQNTFRALKLGRSVREEFENVKYFAIVVQRRFRANRLRRIEQKRYSAMKSSAVKIQNWYRATKAMRIERNYYESLRYSAIRVQQVFRANLLKRKDEKTFQEVRNAAIFIQRRFRANCLRRIAQKRYSAMKSSAVKIQNWYRATKAMKIERNYYESLRYSAIRIQQVFRANLLKRKDEKTYQEVRNAAIFMQRRFRANKQARIEQESYKLLKENVIVVQKRFRALLETRKVRSEFLNLKRTVLIVEMRYEAKKSMMKQREEYLALKASTVLIQRRFRARKLCRIEHETYRKLKETVVMIQRKFRGNKSMKHNRNEFNQLKKSVLLVQRRFRANLAMKKQYSSFNHLKLAVLTVQRRFRANKLARNERETYLKLKSAAVTVQQRFRAKRLREMNVIEYRKLKENTVKIQIWYRSIIFMRKERNCYVLKRFAAILIQQKFRARNLMRLQMESYRKLRETVVLMQNRFRANKLGKKQKNAFLRLRWACVTVQRQFRANKLREIHSVEYNKLKLATIKIQQWFRAVRMMKSVRDGFISLKSSAVVVQRQFRANKQRKEFLALRMACVLIQNKYRAKKQMEIESRKYVLLVKSCRRIQRWLRSVKEMRKIRDEFKSLRNSVVLIQTRFRANLAMRKHRNEYEQLRITVIMVQERFRRKIRARCERNEFLKLRRSVVCVQRRITANNLMKLHRKHFELVKCSTVKIQKWWRSVQETKRRRNEFVALRMASVWVQQHYRANILMKTVRKSYLIRLAEEKERRKQAAIVIQRNIRGFFVRKQYGGLLTPEAVEERRVKRVQSKAATKIQAIWRGHRTRSVQQPEMGKIRERCLKATAKAKPQMTLASRCDRALRLLTDDQIDPTVHEIWKALEDIDFITRRCKTTCADLGRKLPGALYMNIASTSRSLPEMNTCIAAVHILLNFCRFPPTRRYSWQPDSMEQLLTLMVYWSDKDSALFPSLCTLLWLFADNKEYRGVIVQTKNFQLKMKKIETACWRKQKMVEKNSNQMKHSFYGNVKAGGSMPATLPDWGLENPNRPRIFKSSVHGFNCLMQKLSD